MKTASRSLRDSFAFPRRPTLWSAAVAIAAALGLFFWLTRPEHAPIAAALIVDTPAAEMPIASAPGTPIGASDDSRSAVADPTPAEDPPLIIEPELEHPFLYVLMVRTIDEDGLPIRGAKLKLAPARSRLNEVAPLIEVDGWTTIVWRGKEAEMDVDVQFGDSTHLAGSRRVHVRAGTPCEVALLGSSSVQIPIRIEMGDGQRLVFRIGTAKQLRSAGTAQFVTANSQGQALRMARFPHPHARFGDRFVALRTPNPVPEQHLVDYIDVDKANLRAVSRTLNFSGAMQFKLDSSSAAESAAVPTGTSRISVRVLDDQGEPESQCMVALGRELDGTELTSFTDEQGDAAFDSVAPGWWEARAGGGAAGLARERLFVAAPNPLHWNANLDRGARVHGQVLAIEGRAEEQLLVRYESIPDLVARPTTVRMTRETAGGEEISEREEIPTRPRSELRAPWIDQASVLGDRTFEIANLPQELGRLIVLSADNPDGPALFVQEGVFPVERELVMQLGLSSGSLNLRLQLPEPWQRQSVEVRAISESTGRGSSFTRTDEGYRCAGLAPGWYRVEVGAGVLGWHDLGRHYVDAEAQVDLGSFAPPPPGQVRVLLPESADDGSSALTLTFYLRRPDIDIRGEPRSQIGNDRLYLPAGEYWVFWHAPYGPLSHRSLTVEEGATAELDLRDSH